MGYAVRILKDSISPAGARLTTWELTYPRMVHAELLTHRVFSRNAASGRAIPNAKVRAAVENDPALPKWWGKNQAGMQAREELSDDPWFGVHLSGTPRQGVSERAEAQMEWLRARDLMLEASKRLADLGLHKQLCNRLLEPWMFITVIVSATTFDNWFHLRDHEDAQPEIAWVAAEMHRQYGQNTPEALPVGGWHLPLITERDRINVNWNVHLALEFYGSEAMSEERAIELLRKIATGRCARVSLLTHDGKRDLREDIALHDKLLVGAATDNPLHMSPFEHIAQALPDKDAPSGNFRGWAQYRKLIPQEHFGGPMP